MIDEGVADLQAIEPPEEVEDPHAALIDALEAFGDAIGEAEEAAETGDEEELQAGLSRAALDFQQRFAEVTEDLQEAGVEISPPPGEGG